MSFKTRYLALLTTNTLLPLAFALVVVSQHTDLHERFSLSRSGGTTIVIAFISGTLISVSINYALLGPHKRPPIDWAVASELLTELQRSPGLVRVSPTWRLARLEGILKNVNQFYWKVERARHIAEVEESRGRMLELIKEYGTSDPKIIVAIEARRLELRMIEEAKRELVYA